MKMNRWRKRMLALNSLGLRLSQARSDVLGELRMFEHMLEPLDELTEKVDEEIEKHKLFRERQDEWSKSQEVQNEG